MKPRNAQRREEAAKDFEFAAKVAHEAGLTLRSLAYSGGDPNDVTQYRVEGPGWYKDLYPGTQRIYCPDKSKQGPFISMAYGKRWMLTDIVRACIAAMKKAGNTPASKGLADSITGDAYNNRQLLRQMINAIAKTEGTDSQSALRDLLTDLRHVIDHMKLDIVMAMDGSYDVYLEEKSDPEFKFEE